MPPVKAPRVKTRFTNTAGEDVTVMTDGTKTRVPSVAPSTDVPALVAEGNTQPLNIPEPKLDTVNASTAISSADSLTASIQEQEAVRTAQEAEVAKAKVDASETAIRDANAVLGTEAEKRTELETAAGIPAANKRLQDLTTGLASATANLREFDLNFTTQMEEQRVESSKRDLTKRTFNAAQAEANTQMAVQRAGMVGSIFAQQATIHLLGDNVKAATESIDKALNSFYEPIRQDLKMETMFFERNANSFDEARKTAADARLEVIRQKQNDIDRAIDTVDAAVASGFASADDIDLMTSLSGNPKAQRAVAARIIGMGAREMMALDRLAKTASISASTASRRKSLMELAVAGDQDAIAELNFDPGAPVRAKAAAELDVTLGKQIDAQNDIIGKLESVSSLTNAIKASSGNFQNAFITGLLPQEGTYEIPGVGALPGGVQGGFKTMQEKAEFLGTMEYILLGEGFKQFGKLKDEGVNLTPVSEFEFAKIMESANALSSYAIKKDGKISGFTVSDEIVQREIRTMMDAAAKVRDEKAAIKNLGYDVYIELQALQQGQ